MINDFESNRFIYRSLAGADSSHNEMPLLFSDDKVLLNRYFNDLLIYKVAIRGQIDQIKIRMVKAEHLLIYFQNKYRFE
jgi:phage-related protein